MSSNARPQYILFYDGTCALCSFWVQFCLDRNRRKHLFFAPLNGETALALLPKEHFNSSDSVIFWTPTSILTKSQAVLEALKVIGYAPDMVFLIRLIPSSYRDWFYSQIAKRRYQWFGKSQVCRLPPEDQKEQFLK